jgi:hypothetical protein
MKRDPVVVGIGAIRSSRPALLQPASADKGQYQLSEEMTVTDIVWILRADLTTTVITPGAILAEGNTQYRVVKAQFSQPPTQSEDSTSVREGSGASKNSVHTSMRRCSS